MKQEAIAFIKENRVIIAGLIIGGLTRLFKSDTKIPIDIPPKWRIRFVLFLGIVYGIIEQTAAGVSWQEAIKHGLVAASAAVGLHELLINNLRGGRELTVPFLTNPGVPPAPGKPPSIRPPAVAITNEDDAQPEKRDADPPPPPAA